MNETVVKALAEYFGGRGALYHMATARNGWHPGEIERAKRFLEVRQMLGIDDAIVEQAAKAIRATLNGSAEGGKK